MQQELATINIFDRSIDWRVRLSAIKDVMREMSEQTEPREMVSLYISRMQQLIPRDRLISLSRRGQTFPDVRITRDSTWTETIDPWTQKDRLPLIRGGILADIAYADEPVIINDLRVSGDDPGHAIIGEYRSLGAIPLYDQGQGLNWVLAFSREPDYFTHDDFPERVWVSNLFGRATSNLLLGAELRRAYDAIDQELKTVERMQRSLLPTTLPTIPGLDLAAFYETSRHAGGDYYDVTTLPDGRWGILVADASGHGTPAAVLMAVIHAMVHTHPDAPVAAGALLERLNRTLTTVYTHGQGRFVTAFYGIYDPRVRTLTYASAGHNPPRLKRCSDGSLVILDAVGGMPLGIIEDEGYREATLQLQVGDQLIFYTDGITEHFNPAGEQFGTERLDEVLENCALTASGLIRALLGAVAEFANGRPHDDDRTIVVAKLNA